MQGMLKARQGANTDTERARDLVDDVRDGLRKAIAGFNPDSGIAFIRTDAMGYWFKSRKLDPQDLWAMINTKQVTCFHRTIKAFPRSKCHPLHRRGFLYVGPNATMPFDYNVPILRLNNNDKAVVFAGSESSPSLMRQLAAEGWFAHAESVVDVDCEDVDADYRMPEPAAAVETPSLAQIEDIENLAV